MIVPGSTAQGLLLVECWCHLEVVEVPAGEVRNGRTRSCGLPSCRDRRAAP